VEELNERKLESLRFACLACFGFALRIFVKPLKESR
jgi:hypothetical protein